MCPVRCISMRNDKFGELHPYIDETKCIQCNKCVKSCPNNASDLDFNYPKQCFASWITDTDKRATTASGGIGTVIAEYVIRSLNGIVLGTRYDDDCMPITAFADNVEDIEAFKGSKYVQSVVGTDTFRQVLQLLQEGRCVLYIATPCQIAGLKAFLHQDFERLITVDLLCHGVCPTSYFMDEVSYLKKKYHIEKLTSIRFRDNDGHNFKWTMWNGGKLLFNRAAYCSYYFAGFLNGLLLRENCYSCHYAQPERVGDISIGDFIGLGDKEPFAFPTKNVSVVVLNTDKGENFYTQMSTSTSELQNIPRQYAERLQYPYSLKKTFPKHTKYDLFRQDYLVFGYNKAIHKTIGFKIFKSRCWEFLYNKFPKTHTLIRTIIGIK